MTLLQRLLRIVPVTVVAVLACWAATLNNDDPCGTVGECLGTALDDMIVLAIAIPLTGIALRLARTGRAGFHTLAILVVGSSLWYGSGELLMALDPSRSYDALLPFPLALTVGVVTGAVATYVVGPGGGRPGKASLAVIALAFPVVAHLASESAIARYDVERADALGIVLYAPVITGQPHDSAYAGDDTVRLSYSLDIDGNRTSVDVTLLPAPEGSLCEADRVFGGPDCVQDGDTMRDGAAGLSDVGLVRGDTALIAGFDADVLDPDDVLAALREAPDVEAGTLLD